MKPSSANRLTAMQFVLAFGVVSMLADPKLIGMARQKSAERERPLSFLEASAARPH